MLGDRSPTRIENLGIRIDMRAIKQFKRPHFALILVLLCACLGIAQEAGQTVNPPESQPRAVDLIHQGDLIEIDVVGSLEFDWRGGLNPEGYLQDYQATETRLFALCLSTDQLAREIEKSLSRILRDPKVIVRILDTSGRPLTMLYGAVKIPHRFQIKRPVRLNELLVLAGGLTDQLSGVIQIFRPEKRACLEDPTADARKANADGDNGSGFFNISIVELLQGSTDSNVAIYSGDIITVNEAFPVFVVGGVNYPRPVLFRDGLTLTRAIASAGGLARDARPEDVVIFRRTREGSQSIEANLEKIRAKESTDVVLEKLDVIDVGRRGRERRLSPLSDSAFENGSPDSSKMPLRLID